MFVCVLLLLLLFMCVFVFSVNVCVLALRCRTRNSPPCASPLLLVQSQIEESLEECNRRIDDLKAEMEEYTTSADRIRSDIKRLRFRCGCRGGAGGCSGSLLRAWARAGRYGTLRSSAKCELCDSAVLARPFYLFQCMHAFHQDCLAKEVCAPRGPCALVVDAVLAPASLYGT